MTEQTIPLCRNARQRMGAATMLDAVRSSTATLAVFDPQYRGVLDKQKYGNEGQRQQGRAALPQMSYSDIRHILDELTRVLKPSGHVMLWCDKFTVAEGHHLKWTPPGLQRVDLLAWNKVRQGMGKRLRCRIEYLIVMQKPPTKVKPMWTNRHLDDFWMESADISGHVHAKPIRLTQELIKQVTKRGDLVIDPCAGGYGVLEACRATGREFLGCDLIGEDHSDPPV